MMDTAKVDIRKLQLLNDRINQCIDALNQVRLSVHGLSHTSPQQGVGGIPGINPLTQSPSVGMGYPFAQNPLFSPGYTVVPPANPWASASPFVSGLSHTGVAAGVSPAYLGSTGAALPIPGLHPLAALSHTSGEGFETFARPIWADPLLAARIAQTFPYAYVSIPPAVAIY